MACDLEAVQAVLRCVLRLGQRHAWLRSTAEAAVSQVQGQVCAAHAASVQLCGAL